MAGFEARIGATEMKSALAITCAAMILCNPTSASERHKEGRTYKECRKLAIAEGYPVRDPEHYRGNYRALEEVELRKNPRGFIARCMAGLGY